MIWRFPERSEYVWARRACAGLLMLVVLVGGLCPALYGDQIPHEHLFVGGAPPVNWEQHDHPNPLFAFFGSSNRSAQPVDRSVAAAASPGRALETGRVVSVYDGTVFILSIMVVTVALPLLDSLPRPDPGREISFASPRLFHLVVRGPTPPPPRVA